MSETHQKLGLDVPLLSKIDDATLEKTFPHRDGSWSSLTKWAKREFKVEKLDLNIHWAAVPKYWSCPACYREKPDIFRVSENGVLLALLHQHHDHLEDLADDLIRHRLGKHWGLLGSAFNRLESTVADLVSRFRPVLVCHDCNDADGAAKRGLDELPKHFTFAPSEIRSFITPIPNKQPNVDLKKALATYHRVKEDYHSRVDLVTRIVEMVTVGQLGKQHTPPVDDRFWSNFGFQGNMWRTVASAVPAEAKALEDDYAAFKSRSVSFDGANASSQKKLRKSYPAPSDDEYAAHTGSGDPKRWQGVDDSWFCPCCNRSKRETLRRKTNSKQWSGRLYTHTEFIWGDITDAFSGEWRQGWTHCETHLICQDCFSISIKLRQAHADLSHRSFTLQFEHLVPLFTSYAHGAHDLNTNKGYEAALEAEKCEPSIQAFLAYSRSAFDVRYAYESALKEIGDPQRALNYVASRRAYREKQLCHEIEKNLAIWLEEADRLEGLDPSFAISRARWGA